MRLATERFSFQSVQPHSEVFKWPLKEKRRTPIFTSINIHSGYGIKSKS